MVLRTLGGLRLKGSDFTRPQPLMLLAYLSLEGPKERHFLAELFWMDAADPLNRLSTALSRLRKVSAELVQADNVRVWTELATDARQLLVALREERYEEALALYEGPFLEGVALEGSVELEEWVYTTRETFAERVQHALLDLAEATAKEQDFARAGVLAERAYRLPGLGGHDALTLQRLYPLLSAGNSPLAPTVRHEAESYDLRLELNRDAAQALFPPVVLTRPPGPALPVRNTSFVGRDIELSDLASLLARPGVGLVNLVGAGGVGKTRLALTLAHEQQNLSTFKDGVYFVPLDAVQQADLIPSSLLSHFGLKQEAKQTPLEQVLGFLAERHALLILDNVEHLTEGAIILSQLLARCPKLKLLVTSRETLRLEEEHVFPLEGLSYRETASKDTPASEAVRLFNDRAQQVQPRFDGDQQLADVVRICELAEGLPLAIELAASWVRLMSCTEIADEIEMNLELLTSVSQNTPDRHRSLKAVFDTSWQRLSDQEREVLGNLSVFRGGFRREAAANVAGARVPVLASLVDKSLLRVLPDGHFDRHPLLYQFTQEKLAERPADEVKLRSNHAAFYLELAETAEPLLQSKEQVLWFGRLEEELNNLRAALDYLEQSDPALALRLAASLGSFWMGRGHFYEGGGYLTNLLRQPNAPDRTRAKALLHAGYFTWLQGDHQQAQTFYEQGLAIAKQLREAALSAKALEGLGRIAYFNRGDPNEARSRYASGLELARASGDKATLAGVLLVSGAFEAEQADYQRAEDQLKEAEALFTVLGNIQARAKVLNSLANVWVDLGEYDRARVLHGQSLELARAVGDKHTEAIILLNFGNDAGRRGEEARAATHFGDSLQLFRELDDRRMQGYVLVNLAGNYYHQGEFTKAKALLEESLSLQRAVGETGRLADALRKLADVLYKEGDVKGAYAHYQESLTLCREKDDKWALIRVLNALAKWDLNQGDRATARDRLAEGVQLARLTGDQAVLISLLETQAALEAQTGEHALAVQLLARADAQRHAIGLHRKSRYQLEHEKQLEDLQNLLGEALFAQAWSGGQEVELVPSAL